MNKKLLLIGLVMLMLLSTFVQATTNDAILYYSFDDSDITGSLPNDLSDNSTDATYNNGATTGVTGKLNEAFSFDGSNDYITTGTKLDRNFNQPFTVCTWVNRDSTGSWDEIVSTNDHNSPFSGWTLSWESSDKIRFKLWKDTTNRYSEETTSADTTTGTWVFLCAVYKGSSDVDIYKNAVNQATTNVHNTLGSNSGANNQYIMIGTRPNPVTGSYEFGGDIDEVAIYDRALSLSEIQELYNSGDGYNPYTTTSPTDNLTVQVKNIFSNNEITNVSLTLTNSSSWTNETGGIIYTTVGNNSLFNFTINGENHYNESYTNWNSSSTLVANLTSYPLGNVRLIYPNENVLRTTTYDMQWTTAISPADLGVTYNLSIYNTNTSELITSIETTDTNYTWNSTEYNIGNYTTIVIAEETYSGDTTTNYNHTLIKPVEDFVRIYGLNYLETEYINNIETTEHTSGVTQIGNPFAYDIYSFLNISDYQNNETLNFTMSDLGFEHKNYSGTLLLTRFNNTFNVTMQPYELAFTFYQNGNLFDTQGVIHDTSKIEGTYGFQNTSIVILQQELGEGYIKAKLNLINGTNWTQYYEYINDYKTNIDEDIEILQIADWSTFLQVLDYSNSPIKDAVIRAEYSYTEIGNWTNYKLLGQRLTDDEGFTFFIGDSRTEVLFTISKEGYVPVEALITIGDEDFSKAEALTFYLQKSDNGVLNNAWFYIQRDFSNRSLDLSGTITAKGRERVQIQTAYRDTLALAKKDITSTCDGFMRCSFTLESGTDYEFLSTDDITLMMYLDNELWKTVTIDYDQSEKNRVFNFGGLNQTYLNALLLILILLSSLTIGLIFKNSNAGTIAFLTTSIVAGLISTSFLWLTLSITIYILFKLIRRIISE